MKKTLCILLAVLLITALFSGCGEPEPLHVLVDLDYYVLMNYVGTYAEDAVAPFLEWVADLGGPSDIVLEVLPKDGVERDTALTRLRTEIMAGGGPDVFIMACDAGDSYDSAEPLFPIPEKAMEVGMFLTLDEYIENAQYMEWDKLTPAIMNAGKNEYGQQILPLTYTVPVSYFMKSEVSHSVSAKTDWEDMLSDESRTLAAAASWIHLTENEPELYRLPPWEGHHLEYILGDLADYKEEELLFTEEELLRRCEEIFGVHEQYLCGALDASPVCFQDCLSTKFTNEWDTARFNGISKTADLTMVPLYSDDGGVTANILYYAAVNANTKRPEDAFFLLDVLMDRNSQQYSDIYGWCLTRNFGIPTHEDLLQEEYPTRHEGAGYLSESNYAQLCEIRDSITNVRFQGGLDLVLDSMFEEIYYAEVEPEAKDVKEIVSQAYRKMEIMLRE